MNSSTVLYPADGTRLWKSVGGACCIVVLLTGCSRDSTPARAPVIVPRLAATDVARVGDMVISQEAFAREWQRRSDVRSKKDLLQEMIRFESLLGKARAAGVDRDPELVAAFNRMVVGRFQEAQLQLRGIDSVRPGEAEIQASYQTDPNRFTTLRQIRLGIVYCKASAKATPEKREILRHQAEMLWNEAKESDDQGFRQLALRHSEDQATRYAGGDTGWFTPEQTTRWEPEVIKAASALSEPGELAPLLLTSNGFYIVKLLGAKPEARRPLEDVRDGIEYRLRMEKAQLLRQKFFQEMQAGLAIEVNRSALEAVPDRVMQAQAAPAPSPLK